MSHGLPQAQRVRQAFDPQDVVVLGLHTVFEHHEVMTRDALAVFIAEYRLAFPVGIDQHDGNGPLPVTMRRYAFRGTPSTVLIDRDGAIRFSAFGAVDDLVLGARIGRLLAEPRSAPASEASLEPVVTPTAESLAKPGDACAPGESCD